MGKEVKNATPTEEREIRPALTIGEYSIGFIFFGKPFQGINTESLNHKLEEKSELYRKSLSAYASYIQDIIPFSFHKETLPITGCCSSESACPVAITFPADIHYGAEGKQVKLTMAGQSKPYSKTCQLRENYTLFATGHVAYHAFFVHDENAGTATQLNEYEVIALSKLFYQTEVPLEHDKNLREQILFAVGNDKPLPLATFLDKRIKDKNAGGALRQVLTLVAPRYDFDLRWENLRGGTIYIANGEYFSLLQKMVAEEDGQEIPADTSKAVVGILQGILDFPNVDAAELKDSLDPATDTEYGFYQMHPKMLVVIDEHDRPFFQNKNTSGVSPYRLLPQVFLLYNELLLSEQEQLLHELRFGSQRQIAQKQLLWIDEIYDHIDSSKNKHRFHRHLKQKLDVYRSLFLNYLPNMFRYQTERDLFVKGTDVRGLRIKVKAYKAHLRNLDSLLHDADMLYEQAQASKTNRDNTFMNGILVVISGLSLFQIREALLQLVSQLVPGVSVPAYAFEGAVGVILLYGFYKILSSFLRGS